MKVKSSIVINDAYDRHRKDFALISNLFRNFYIESLLKHWYKKKIYILKLKLYKCHMKYSQYFSEYKKINRTAFNQINILVATFYTKIKNK